MLYEVQSATIVFFTRFAYPTVELMNLLLVKIPLWMKSLPLTFGKVLIKKKKTLADYRRLKFFPQVLKSSA